MAQPKKILITGPVPPPAGGISIHISRLQYLLKDNFAIDFIDESSLQKPGIFNLRSYNFFLYIKKMLGADLVYVQSGSTYLRLIQLFFAKLLFKKIILTIHAYPFNKKGVAYFLDNSIFNFANKIIVVNESILTRLSLPPQKCAIKIAFLPPVMELEPALPNNISDIILSAKNDGAKIICGNASRLDFYNNEDLYGVDMCIEVSKYFKQQSVKHIFIFIVSSLDDGKTTFEKYVNQIKAEGLENSFFLLNTRLSFVRLIEEADVIVRPTNTDGDAITIREVLYLHKPILASDAVARPEGTLLFKNRNVDDFKNKLLNIISQSNTSITDKQRNDNDDKSFYINIINSVLKN
ncbi:MAG: glycosyltransferase [Bacteroidetes bacterium]|nr:glycosyltransferase [Bacteroidota bacterium]